MHHTLRTTDVDYLLYTLLARATEDSSREEVQGRNGEGLQFKLVVQAGFNEEATLKQKLKGGE